jgi:oligopeptide/dipeptide ABC transporter ATP-binding protein
MTPALALDRVVKRFPGPRPGTHVHALNDVTLHVRQGETIALVGESGSGKSTLGRIALRLQSPSGGRVTVAGTDITDTPLRRLRALRPRMQMVFQDPWSTLNPRLTVRRAVEEPLILHERLGASERRERVEGVASQVRLDSALLDRYPVQLSGGQLQRVAIARALVTRPQLVVLDEPTSSLDLSVRAEIMDLLHSIRQDHAAAYLFITHDLSNVRLIADRVAVLYLGSIMEEGPAAEVFTDPQHPYTQVLFSAEVPTRPGARRHPIRVEGEIPSPVDLPAGCPFSSRCPAVLPACRAAKPPLLTRGRRSVACIRLEDGGHRLLG